MVLKRPFTHSRHCSEFIELTLFIKLTLFKSYYNCRYSIRNIKLKGNSIRHFPDAIFVQLNFIFFCLYLTYCHIVKFKFLEYTIFTINNGFLFKDELPCGPSPFTHQKVPLHIAKGHLLESKRASSETLLRVYFTKDHCLMRAYSRSVSFPQLTDGSVTAQSYSVG